MARTAPVSKTVVIGKVIHTEKMGYVVEYTGGSTVLLPPHIAKFFEDKGLVA